MAAQDPVLTRIRAEYQEMPGLRLSVAQACRLWQLDGTTCLAVLEQLVAERFLHRTQEGAYIAFSNARPKPLKAGLPAPPSTSAHSRRSA